MRRFFDLDAMAAGARALCDALLRGSEPYGCFRWREQPLPNLLYLNDVVMLRWVIDDLPADVELRARWAATLNRFQCPEGGAYCYPPFAQPNWQHATMNTVIALNMLGARPARPLAMLEPLRDIDTCRRWVESHADPHTAVPHHRYGLGAVLMHSKPAADGRLGGRVPLRHPPPPGPGERPVPQCRRAHQHQRHFHVLQDPVERGGEPRAEAMFDALLAAQRPDGAFTDHDALGYHDMDAAFLIAHVAEHHGYGPPTPAPPCAAWPPAWPPAWAPGGSGTARSAATPTKPWPSSAWPACWRAPSATRWPAAPPAASTSPTPPCYA